MPKLRRGEAFIEMLREDTSEERLATSLAVRARTERIRLYREGPGGSELDREVKFVFPEAPPLGMPPAVYEDLREKVSGILYSMLIHLDPPLCEEEGCEGALTQDAIMAMPMMATIVGMLGPVSFAQFEPGRGKAPSSEELSEDDLMRGLREGHDFTHPPKGLGEEE